MNLFQFKNPVSHTCLAGAVIASWSLSQEVAGLSPFTEKTNIFVTESSEFSEKYLLVKTRFNCFVCNTTGQNHMFTMLLIFFHTKLNINKFNGVKIFLKWLD